MKHTDIIDKDPRQNEIKICVGCGKHKPRKEFPVNKVKSNGTIVRRTLCLSCDRKRQEKIRRNKGIVSSLIPSIVKNNETLYQCDICGKFKHKHDFPADRYYKNTIGIKRPCKDCRKSKHRETRVLDVDLFLNDQQEEDRDKHYGSISRIKRVLLNTAKERSKRRNIEFNLTEDDIDLPERCPILGIKIIPGIGAQSPNSPSIDRIDLNKGYIKGNVCVISYRANAMKNDASIEELYSFAKNILSYIEMKR